MQELVRLSKARSRFDPKRIDEVGTMSLADVTRDLVSILGAKLTAYIGNVSATRYVRSWEEGVPPQRPEALKVALQAARVLKDFEGPEAARGWFMGCNTKFDLNSPADVLRANAPEQRSGVLRAAIAKIAD